MKIRNAKRDDIEKIVSIHLERFFGFFLTSLGRDFLETFYKAFIKYPGVLLVIEDEMEVKGFVAGSRMNRGFFKKLLLNNFAQFFFVGIKILLTSPKALFRIAFNIGKSEKNEIVCSELMSIATVTNTKGYGKALVKAFEEEVKKEKLPISLTTDYINNEKAVQFYKDCGYEVKEIFESYQGRKMFRFVKKDN